MIESLMPSPMQATESAPGIGTGKPSCELATDGEAFQAALVVAQGAAPGALDAATTSVRARSQDDTSGTAASDGRTEETGLVVGALSDDEEEAPTEARPDETPSGVLPFWLRYPMPRPEILSPAPRPDGAASADAAGADAGVGRLELRLIASGPDIPLTGLGRTAFELDTAAPGGQGGTVSTVTAGPAQAAPARPASEAEVATTDPLVAAVQGGPAMRGNARGIIAPSPPTANGEVAAGPIAMPSGQIDLVGSSTPEQAAQQIQVPAATPSQSTAVAAAQTPTVVHAPATSDRTDATLDGLRPAVAVQDAQLARASDVTQTGSRTDALGRAFDATIRPIETVAPTAPQTGIGGGDGMVARVSALLAAVSAGDDLRAASLAIDPRFVDPLLADLPPDGAAATATRAIDTTSRLAAPTPADLGGPLELGDVAAVPVAPILGAPATASPPTGSSDASALGAVHEVLTVDGTSPTSANGSHPLEGGLFGGVPTRGAALDVPAIAQEQVATSPRVGAAPAETESALAPREARGAVEVAMGGTAALQPARTAPGSAEAVSREDADASALAPIAIQGGPAPIATTATGEALAPTLPPSEQLADGAEEAIRRPGQTVRLVLQPEGLGTVSLRIAVEPTGVGIHIGVDSPMTRDLVQTSWPQLQQALDQRGLSVETLLVDLAGSQARPASGQDGMTTSQGGLATGQGGTANGQAGTWGEGPRHQQARQPRLGAEIRAGRPADDLPQPRGSANRQRVDYRI